MKIQPLSEHTGVQVIPTSSTDVDSIDIDKVIDELKANGAVYFKGFNADEEAFESFTDKFSNDYMDNTGSGSYRDKASSKTDNTIQNVAYVYGVNRQRTFGLPLHADRSYIKSQPELIWFMCKQPSETGGQTILCDGVKVYQALSNASRELLSNKKLKYIRYYTADEWPVLFKTESKEDIEEYCKENDMSCHFDADDSLTTEFVKSAFVTTRFGEGPAFVTSILIQLWQEDELGRKTSLSRLEDGSKIPAEVLDDIKKVCDDYTIEIPMQAQDFVMVDNTRLMHGRRKFTGENRAVFVRMCRSVDW
jgi:alpha-ketoglutarate-dependent taurine dioxygenase